MELITGKSYDEYFSMDGITQSILKRFKKSPAHAREDMLHPRSQTPAMATGHAVHAAVLEPKVFLENFVSAPKVDKRTTVGKAKLAEFELRNVGKEWVSDSDFELCIRISNACWSHPVASELLSGEGSNEVVALWNMETPHGTIACKGRQDRITTFASWSVVVDLKTCDDAGPWAFGSAISKFGYHNQAAWYLDGLNLIAPRDRKFVMIAVEKVPPYALQCYILDEPSIMQGRDENEKRLRQYAECQATGEWPAYETKLKSISIPAYALRPDEWEAGE